MRNPETLAYMDLIKAIALHAVKLARTTNPKRRARFKARLRELEREHTQRVAP